MRNGRSGVSERVALIQAMALFVMSVLKWYSGPWDADEGGPVDQARTEQGLLARDVAVELVEAGRASASGRTAR